MNHEILNDAETPVLSASHGFAGLALDDIICLEADGSYTTVILNVGTHANVSRTLKDFEVTIPNEWYIHIVNYYA